MNSAQSEGVGLYAPLAILPLLGCNNSCMSAYYCTMRKVQSGKQMTERDLETAFVSSMGSMG